MMLTKRIIATVLVSNGMVVQSRQFKHTNVIGNVSTVIDFFDQWDADEIVILDVSREKDPNFLKTVEEASKKCFVPMAVGGWIRSLDDIRDALHAGADKVVINTEAFRNPKFISKASSKFGKQCIVVSIDYKYDDMYYDKFNPKRRVRFYINRGQDCQDDNYVAILSKVTGVVECGAGEIYLTSIDKDGMGTGYDLLTLKKISSDIAIPIIISGGCGNWHHLAEAFDAGTDACSIANRLHFSEHSIREAKKYLYEKGYPIRMPGNRDPTPQKKPISYPMEMEVEEAVKIDYLYQRFKNR